MIILNKTLHLLDNMTCTYTTVQDFFNSAGKLLGGSDSVGCNTRFALLNTALKHMYKDMEGLGYLYGVVPFTVGSNPITISTQADPNLPYGRSLAPIFKVMGFYTNITPTTTSVPSCLEEVDEECFGCCDTRTKTYKINMFDVMQSSGLLSGQYYTPCQFGDEIYANIPCNITDGFVKYQRWFHPITSLSDNLPVPEILIPALQMILMFYALPSSGQGFKGDDIKYYQAYTDYMASVQNITANTPTKISFRT